MTSSSASMASWASPATGEPVRINYSFRTTDLPFVGNVFAKFMFFPVAGSKVVNDRSCRRLVLNRNVAQSGNHGRRSGVDLRHQIDLSRLLDAILLIDTEGIDPKYSGHRFIA